jgi:phage-related minor tail protein
MKTKFKNIAIGAVLASSMAFATGTAMARDYRYDRRGGYDQRALAEAQNQLNYDLQHKASRKKLAQDQAVIDQIVGGGNAGYYGRGGYDRRALAEAQNQLNYDLQHKASRQKLAQDQAVIDQILAGQNGYAQRDNGWWHW